MMGLFTEDTPMTPYEMLALRDRTMATLNWAALAFRPGSVRRVAADGIVAKLRMPSTEFVPTHRGVDAIAVLQSFSVAAGRLNEQRHAFPGSHHVDANRLACLPGVDARALDFGKSDMVTYAQVRWVLSVSWPRGNLADDVAVLLSRLEWEDHLALEGEDMPAVAAMAMAA
jgi:hypothetical protein